MIINGYDTVAGRRVSVVDDVSTALKTLSVTSRLKPYGRNTGVFLLDWSNGEALKTMVFPLSLKDFRNQPITILDTRHYLNKEGKVVNPAEHDMMLLAALLQQRAYKNDIVPLTGTRVYTLRAFVLSVSDVLGRRLSPAQRLDVQIILGHYYNCLLTPQSVDVNFVTQNVLNNSLKISPQTSGPVIDEIGYINTLTQLVDTLKSYPTLGSLSKLEIGGFIGVVNQTFFTTSGFREIIGASVEMPHLYTAICYASATNNFYRKTPIGLQMDSRNRPGIENFVNLINNVWTN